MPLRVEVKQSRRVSEMTIAHYDRMAEAYWEGTRDQTSAKTIRRFWKRLRTILPIPFLIWVVDRAETSAIFVHWATTL